MSELSLSSFSAEARASRCRHGAPQSSPCIRTARARAASSGARVLSSPPTRRWPTRARSRWCCPAVCREKSHASPAAIRRPNVALLRVEGADAAPAAARRQHGEARRAGARHRRTRRRDAGVVRHRVARGAEVALAARRRDRRPHRAWPVARPSGRRRPRSRCAGHAIGMACVRARRRVLVIPSATIERVAPRLETHGQFGARLSRPWAATGAAR